jgi:hypothetical protein
VQRDGNRNRRLGYDHSPHPRQVVADFRAEKFDHATLCLLVTLYDRANTDALIAGRECLRIRLETLHRWARWPEDLGSLRRQLHRLRADGRLDYSAGRGPCSVWAFTLPKPMSTPCPLFGDPPARSQGGIAGPADE